jgi:cysteine desulfurase/selenocysteine lyase
MVETASYTEEIRKHFPLLHQEVNGHGLVYFDNAATSQKPQVVIDALARYYQEYNANIHRGVHYLANLATSAFEETRAEVRRFLNAKEEREIIFTSGTTDSINLVAQAWGRANLQAGDEILVSTLEHHSNIVPWQMIAEERGAVLKVIPLNVDGSWSAEQALGLITPKLKMVAINHVSNSLGVINPIKPVIDAAHAVGAKVLVDGAQAVVHFEVDVQALNCDFYCFSGHKAYGPTGTGILYGKADLLEHMPPYRGGGEMIKSVSFSGTTYNTIPHKFEAGTPNIEGFIGLGYALKYAKSLGWENVKEHESQLLSYATQQLKEIEGMRIFGDVKNKVSVISFLVEGVHPYDLGTLLDKQGIAVRTGHHCTQPLWDWYGVPGSVRASFAVYNTLEEVDRFVAALRKALMLLR